MQVIIKEHINLGLIEPGISAYSSPGFLIKTESESKKFTAFSTPQGIELQEHIVEKIRNFPDILKDKKQLQSFLGVVNFAGIFIKDLAKYRKDFRPLLKETDSAKWKWEEIHTQRVRELKQVCNNLPKLAIPQDEDELVVYTDANDYRWAAVLMKRLLQGKNLVDTLEGCSMNNKPECGTSTRKSSLQFGRLLRNGLCFYWLKNSL
ncbi:UNVERIFIED_CONTAM: Enzymatic polyprotein [Sesamum radiatum]|uniref:Enzymatic polyprotein n=1 Tax=Sesamum radiatum TaxID=300843 RepID=A0AAW2WLI1_SESRA